MARTPSIFAGVSEPVSFGLPLPRVFFALTAIMLPKKIIHHSNAADNYRLAIIDMATIFV